MHFAVIARDHKTPETLGKRLVSRPEHMNGLRQMKTEGQVIDGGAILDRHGNMVGSVMLLDLPDRAALDVYLALDPYNRDSVWGDIEIVELRRVDWARRRRDISVKRFRNIRSR